MTALIDTKVERLNILVVCPETGMENVLTKIRRWNSQERNQLKKWHFKSNIKKKFDLNSAIETAYEDIEQSILVPIGYDEQDVRISLAQRAQNSLEVIIRPPRKGQINELNEFPSSSLFSDSHLINVQNTLPALHKSCLKRYFQKRVQIKSLKTQSDFEQYFRLRYQVWKEVGYLKSSRDSLQTQWEIDYTDRTALPIGVFDNNGKMIACARLVFPSGDENYHVQLLEAMIAQTNDPKLFSNFERRRFLIHPFDVLESFAGFNDYYANTKRQGIRVAEVSRVIVDKQYRSFGLGEVLVDSIVNRAQAQGKLDQIFLACKEDHEPFYQRCGFETLEGIESDHFVNMEVQSIAMVRNLKTAKPVTRQLIH